MLRFVCLSLFAVMTNGQGEYSREPDPHWWVALLLLMILIVAFIIPFACRYLCLHSRDNGLKPTDRGLAKVKSVAQLARYRQAVRNSHLNEVPSTLPPSGRYIGEFKDEIDARFIDYELNFDGDGTVRGSLRNPQRTYVVRGFYHAAKEAYIWGETDNVHRFDAVEDPIEVESTIISSITDRSAPQCDKTNFVDRVFHSEIETRLKDAEKGHLFITFIRSTGTKGAVLIGNTIINADFVVIVGSGAFHCKYCPIGHISSEMMS